MTKSDDHESAGPSRISALTNLNTTTPATLKDQEIYPAVTIPVYDSTADTHSETVVYTQGVPEQSGVIKPNNSSSSVKASTEGNAMSVTRAQQLQQMIVQAHEKVTELDEGIRELQGKIVALLEKEGLADPKNPRGLDGYWEISLAGQSEKYCKEFIATMSKYNDVQDAANVLLNIIADREGRTVKSVMRERGITND